MLQARTLAIGIAFACFLAFAPAAVHAQSSSSNSSAGQPATSPNAGQTSTTVPGQTNPVTTSQSATDSTASTPSRAHADDAPGQPSQYSLPDGPSSNSVAEPTPGVPGQLRALEQPVGTTGKTLTIVHSHNRIWLGLLVFFVALLIIAFTMMRTNRSSHSGGRVA